jgi:predicted RNase H-like HicB family nuclease
LPRAIRHAVVIEKGERNHAACVPGRSDCVATGDTLEEVVQQIREAIAFRIQGLGATVLPWRRRADFHGRVRRSHCEVCSMTARTKSGRIMNITLECEQEDDGRWLAEVPEMPGALAYGQKAEDATARAEVPALRVLADRLESGEVEPLHIRVSVPAA